MSASYEPLIVVFSCRWGGAESLGAEDPRRLIRVPVVCAGNVHPDAIIQALSTGADGVLLAACASPGCHYPEGDEKARSRAEAVKLLLEDFGLEAERFRFEMLQDGPRQLESAVAEMADTLRTMGPSPYA
jgi:F420-non-reducing hydrogenase iron-sulfur subunit